MTFSSVFRPNLLAGKVYIVSGGGTGIGRCIAHELSSLGGKVALCGRKIESLETVKQEIESAGGEAFILPCNLREQESVKAFVEATLNHYGRIDGLVNNGGGQFMSPAQFISPNGWKAVIETNLNGTWFMTQAVQQAYMEQHGGAIVNITMDNARGYPTMAHSGAARAGVENLTKTLAVEWAQFGIRINSVAPGIINSSGLTRYPDEVKAQFDDIAKTLPSKRFGTEAEVSGLVTFLLSPVASFITGQTVWVDGGGSLWRSYYPIEDHDNWDAPYLGFEG